MHCSTIDSPCRCNWSRKDANRLPLQARQADFGYLQESTPLLQSSMPSPSIRIPPVCAREQLQHLLTDVNSHHGPCTAQIGLSLRRTCYAIEPREADSARHARSLCKSCSRDVSDSKASFRLSPDIGINRCHSPQNSPATSKSQAARFPPGLLLPSLCLTLTTSEESLADKESRKISIKQDGEPYNYCPFHTGGHQYFRQATLQHRDQK